jgi:hypothetical protein
VTPLILWLTDMLTLLSPLTAGLPGHLEHLVSSLLLRRLVCRKFETLSLMCRCTPESCSCPSACLNLFPLPCCSLMGVVGATLNKVGRTAHIHQHMDSGLFTVVMLRLLFTLVHMLPILRACCTDTRRPSSQID